MSGISPPSAEASAQEVLPGNLRRGLDRELALYRELSELAARSLRLVGDRGDPCELVPVLEEKQRLIREVRGLQDDLRPEREAWRALGHHRSPGALAELEQITGEMEALLREIIRAEEEVGFRLGAPGGMAQLDVFRRAARPDRQTGGGATLPDAPRLWGTG